MSDRTQSAKIQKISASSVRGIHLPTLHSACPGHCPRPAALPGSPRCFHCPKTCSDVVIGHVDIGHAVTGRPPLPRPRCRAHPQPRSAPAASPPGAAPPAEQEGTEGRTQSTTCCCARPQTQECELTPQYRRDRREKATKTDRQTDKQNPTLCKMIKNHRK